MASIQVDLPESVLGTAEEAKFLLALKLFELGRLSSSRAAELCAMNRVDFLLRASKSGTPVTDLDEFAPQEFSS
jgi:predicted HTH domain antitoxin